MKGVRYVEAAEIPTDAWRLQGTVYDTAEDAKFAAAKVFSSCNTSGVIVKRLQKGGYTVMFWRYRHHA